MKSFADVLHHSGRGGQGCEVCKPAVASILAGLWNDFILKPEHQTLQDSNDRFLANIQRDGTYSVVPRVPGGESTPEKLIVLGVVARKYNLYTKITGGQRVDLFGAKVQDLRLDLGRTDRGGFRKRSCLRKVPANSEELRRDYLVSLRGPGFGGVRNSHRTPLQGRSFTA